jgi:hypothetical protein
MTRAASISLLLLGFLAELFLLGILVVGLTTDDFGLGARDGRFFFILSRRLFAVDGGGLGIGHERGALGQIVNIRRGQVAVELEVIDVDVQGLGDRNRGGFDLNLVQRVRDDAARLLAGRLALEQQGDLDGHAFVGVDPQQVDVEQVLLEDVPLHVLEQGLAGGIASEVDDLVAVAEGSPKLVGGDADHEGLFAVPVDDAGEDPLDAKAPVAALAGFSAFLDFENVGHVCDPSAYGKACEFLANP